MKAVSILCNLTGAIGLEWRRYIHDKLDQRVMHLRKSRFMVEVYENNLVCLGQKEAGMVARQKEFAAEAAPTLFSLQH